MLNDPSRVLTTIEDPVEFQFPGITQVEVNMKSGLTFGRGLRTILRADPDVLLVGEVRDEETARIAVQAALTGHLVLTTLHAHNAASSIARLKDMGVEPNLLATSINCIVAQRLARRLCPDCREPYDPTDEELQELRTRRGGAAVPAQSAAGAAPTPASAGASRSTRSCRSRASSGASSKGRRSRSSPPQSSRACARSARTACGSRSPA